MAEIYIYDEIGPDYWGLVSAQSVIDELQKIGAENEVTVRINSPGGDVVQAEAMYNALNRHNGIVIVEIDALAASAASYVAMAGDEIRIAENAKIMIHNAWTIAMGDASELRKTADTLEKYTQGIAEVYAKRSGMSLDEIIELMADETWMTATEAVEMGFATAISQPLKVKANIRTGQFRNQPQSLNAEYKRLFSHAMRERQLKLLKLK